MYNNPYQFPTAYNTAFSNPYMTSSPMNNYQPQQPSQRYEILKVNGKGGADMFQMAPNSQVLLLDETAPIVWVKSTDSAGFATCKPYKIEPYEEQQTQVTSALEERVARLEKLYEQSNFNQSQYTANGNEQFAESESDQKFNGNDQRGTESKGYAQSNRK